jgi:hypothetical protein
MSRAIPLLPLYAFETCHRANFTFYSDYSFRARNSHNSNYFPKQYKPLGICYRTVYFPVRTEFLNNADSDNFGPGQPIRYSDSVWSVRSEDRFPVG